LFLQSIPNQCLTANRPETMDNHNAERVKLQLQFRNDRKVRDPTSVPDAVPATIHVHAGLKKEVL
jgi:hypothetical protein